MAAPLFENGLAILRVFNIAQQLQLIRKITSSAQFQILKTIASQREFPAKLHRVDANLSCRRHGMALG
jgi:hypothetical protein